MVLILIIVDEGNIMYIDFCLNYMVLLIVEWKILYNIIINYVRFIVK